MQSVSPTSALIQILRRRETIIADHSWRDRDPADHLAALRRISEDVSNWIAAHEARIDPRLRHFLANASFAKALVYLDDDSGD